MDAEPDLELIELRSFIAVAERGSVLGAAEALNTTRGRVRRHLDALERTMGVPLLHRSREGVELSDEGKLLLVKARALIGGAHELVQEFRQLATRPRGLIRLGLQVGYPREIALAVNQFLRSHFKDSVRVNRVAERPVDLLPDKVDVVICLGEQTPRVPCLDLEVARIDQSLFATRSYMEKVGTPTLPDIERGLLGVWQAPNEDAQVLHLRAGGTHRIHPSLITSDEQYLKLLALRQEGFVYAPLPITPLDPAMRELVPVRTDLVGQSLRGRLLISESLAKTAHFQLVLSTLRNFMKDVGV